MAEQPSNLIERFKTDLARDKRKTALLVGLTVLAGVVLFRTFSGKSSPKTSEAAVVVTTDNTGPETVEPAAPSVPDTSPPPAAAEPAVDLTGLSKELKSNPFQVDWRDFDLARPLPVQAPQASPAAKQAVGLLTWLTRRSAEAAQRAALSRARQESIRQEAAQLTLQSTLTGAAPMAYISGQLVRQGETLNGVRIRRIEAKRVLIAKEGLEIWLTMR
jgi:hypothetical protein